MSIKFMKINKYEPAADEKRLEEMAVKGEFIKSYSMGMAFFKKAEPQKVKYCIEANVFKANIKTRKAYAESGWTYAARGSDFDVYVSSDENAVPLHTDRSEYAHVIQRFHRTAMWVMIYCFITILWCIIVPFYFYQFIEAGVIAPMLSSIWDNGLAYANLSACIILFAGLIPMTGVYLYDYTEAGKFIAGSIENNKSAEKAMRYSNVAKVIFGVLFTAAFALFGASIYAVCIGESREVNKLDDVPSQAITLDEIFGEEHIVYLETDELADKYIDPEDKEDTRKGVKPKIEEVTSDIFTHYSYWQPAAYIPDGEKYGDRTLVHGTYTNFKNELLAKQCAKEFMQNIPFFFGADESAEVVILDITGTEFDSAEYASDKKDRCYFVLRDGNIVYTLTVYIPDNLDTTPEEIFNGIHK